MKQTTLSRQELYVKHHQRHHQLVSFYRGLFFVLFLILWELCSEKGLIDSFFFSSPGGIIRCTIRLWKEQELPYHISTTLIETTLSFLLVSLISLLTATLLWYSEFFSEILEPYLVILNSLPKSALAPLLIVWLGTGMKTIIIAGISVAIFGSVISVYTAFKQTDKDKIMLIRTLGGSRPDIFTKLVLPSSLPQLISIAKVNIGLSLVGVIIGEFLAARRGLGYLIIYGSQVFKLDMVISSILILCIIAFAFYKLIQIFEHGQKKRNQTPV